MKISVAVQTYNHEKFIAQALDSVLMQNVDYEYEIVIGEDRSTDSTRAIVTEYKRRYPDKIRLILPDENLGFYGNVLFQQIINACRGEYVALLDGDDYWTAADKVQKQVDFLDAHPECTICHHNVMMVYEDNSRAAHPTVPTGLKPISDLEDFLLSQGIETSATMFRRGLFGDFPEQSHTLRTLDTAFHAFNAQYGKIGYIDEVMSVYRFHSGAVWNPVDKISKLEAEIETYRYLKNYLGPQYRKLVDVMIAYYMYRLAVQYERNGDIERARAYLMKSLLHRPFNQHVPTTQLAELLIKLYAPAFYTPLQTLLRGLRSAMATSGILWGSRR